MLKQRVPTSFTPRTSMQPNTKSSRSWCACMQGGPRSSDREAQLGARRVATAKAAPADNRKVLVPGVHRLAGIAVRIYKSNSCRRLAYAAPVGRTSLSSVAI